MPHIASVVVDAVLAARAELCSAVVPVTRCASCCTFLFYASIRSRLTNTLDLDAVRVHDTNLNPILMPDPDGNSVPTRTLHLTRTQFYVDISACSSYRTLEAFSGWLQYLRLASASVVMLFAEVVAFEAVILMAGYLPDPAAQVWGMPLTPSQLVALLVRRRRAVICWTPMFGFCDGTLRLLIT